jgi:hypothetical protein
LNRSQHEHSYMELMNSEKYCFDWELNQTSKD